MRPATASNEKTSCKSYSKDVNLVLNPKCRKTRPATAGNRINSHQNHRKTRPVSACRRIPENYRDNRRTRPCPPRKKLGYFQTKKNKFMRTDRTTSDKENLNHKALLVQKYYGVKIDVKVPQSLGDRRKQILDVYFGTKTPII